MKIKTKVVWAFIKENYDGFFSEYPHPLSKTDLESYKKEIENFKNWIEHEIGVEIRYNLEIVSRWNRYNIMTFVIKNIEFEPESTVIDTAKFVYWALKYNEN